MIFIVDISGSMDYDNRLEAAKRLMLGLLAQAAPADRAGLVVYGDTAEVRAPLQATEDAPRLQQVIRQLHTAGATNAAAGIQLAYELAAAELQRGPKVRLVLFSDGVGNVGETGPDQILALVDQAAQRRVTLTTVGVGFEGNYNDVMLERLANRGNGTYHYIEDREAETEFLAGPAQAVFTRRPATPRIQVEFDPASVRKYRLLGYENRAQADDSFRDDTEGLREIGFRADVTALYEVRPLQAQPQGPLATVRLRYRDLVRGRGGGTVSDPQLGRRAGAGPLFSAAARRGGMGGTTGQILLCAVRQHRGRAGGLAARRGRPRPGTGGPGAAEPAPVRALLCGFWARPAPPPPVVP